jgi:hypothetical protein
MSKYTVTDPSGSVIGRGLTAVEAAHKILSYDGHEYILHGTPDGTWYLYVSRDSQNAEGGNGGFTTTYGALGTLIISFAESREAAWQDIAEQVIRAEWRDWPVAMDDDDYDELMEEAAGEKNEKHL